MKLPSLYSLWISLKTVAIRFPLQVLAAITATIIWCYLADPTGHYKTQEDNLLKLLLVCNLSLALLLAADLYAEAANYTSARKWGLRLLCLCICTALYFILHPAVYKADAFRIALLALAFHLLVAFAPYINKDNLNGFWEYNKTLFLRFLTSALYAGVLFSGLAVAIGAVNALFDANIGFNTYHRLFAIITGSFMTIFFLAGLPLNLHNTHAEETYPKALKIFTQYVLIPLAIIYLAILLVYEIKIAINWELPRGMVSTLILGYAVFGILSLLLIYPIKDKEGNGWIKLFSKFFYIMMLPLLVLLVLAVWERVSSYGITESRYLLIVLALWLASITFYFLLSKKQNIKVIPVSLCLLALLATYGPQSAFSVSKYAQVARLKDLMKEKKDRDDEQINSVMEYLVDQHGLQSLQSFTSADLEHIEDEIELKSVRGNRYFISATKLDTAHALLKVEKESFNNYITFNLIPEGKNLLDINGYNKMVNIERFENITESKLNGIKLTTQKMTNNNLKISLGKDQEMILDINKMVIDAVTHAKSKDSKQVNGSSDEPAARTGAEEILPINYFTVSGQLNRYQFKFIATSINTNWNPKLKTEKIWTEYGGYLLIKTD
ncbi:DUF4153 domain-containing protein [Pedobacter sp. MC2016-14]|uniref:DUF4153 domain-containing protein n=1 Tax=Pedobacter sp. MC2016-14 TaxID=2897327 RepID=UPI001E4C75DA|nr:DUF4153 domain-containing protein [Pedobacter sp. MC2016-14]MCD0488381.1 DUF4153 domain-containing protein [Pedobacter sp. MC2016-14]